MAEVTVELPSLLAPMAGDLRTIPLAADTLRGALDALVAAHPALGIHLFDETGVFRPHVLCFLNESNTRWLGDADLAMPVADGDVVTIMQAVSGG